MAHELTLSGGSLIEHGVAGANSFDCTSSSLSIADVSASEGNGSVLVTISLSDASFTDVTVDYATANNTATAGVDYVAASGTATIAAGATSTTVSISLTDDTTVENSETFFLNLTNPVGAAITDNQALVTINDNDTTQISIPDSTVNEFVGTASLVINLSNPSDFDIMVNYATSAGSHPGVGLHKHQRHGNDPCR